MSKLPEDITLLAKGFFDVVNGGSGTAANLVAAADNVSEEKEFDALKSGFEALLSTLDMLNKLGKIVPGFQAAFSFDQMVGSGNDI